MVVLIMGQDPITLVTMGQISTIMKTTTECKQKVETCMSLGQVEVGQVMSRIRFNISLF